jgi:hypothetical protein
MSDPYRTPQLPTLGPQPSCPCGMSIETKQAMAAIGGWWHNRECIEWHRLKAAHEKQEQ